MGLLNDKKATCYPGFESELEGAVCCNAPCVQDNKIITGKGPGATVDFASVIITELCSEDTAKNLRASMQCNE